MMFPGKGVDAVTTPVPLTTLVRGSYIMLDWLVKLPWSQEVGGSVAVKLCA
jgi:hypothetical protein